MFSKQTTRPWRRGNTSGAQQAREVVNLLNDAVLPRISQLFLSVIAPTSETPPHVTVFIKTMSYSAGTGSQSSVPFYEILMRSSCKHHIRPIVFITTVGGKKAYIFNQLQYSKERRGLYDVCLCFLKAVNVMIFHSGSIPSGVNGRHTQALFICDPRTPGEVS